MWTRKCPTKGCKNVISYRSENNYKYAEKNGTICPICTTKRATTKRMGQVIQKHIRNLLFKRLGYFYILKVYRSHNNSMMCYGFCFFCMHFRVEPIANILDAISEQREKALGCGKCASHRSARTRVKLNVNGAFSLAYSGIKFSAKRRDLDWNLNKDFVEKLIVKKCFYDNSPPSNLIFKQRKHITRQFAYNGLDRIDNTKGYEIDNVVPCCKTCNKAKDIMSQEEFRSWIIRVHSHWVLPTLTEDEKKELLTRIN